MKKPKISVIIPCYNQAPFLAECLQSLQAQHYSDWEAIIINDGSTDNSGTIAKKFAAADTRFIYLKTENRGVSEARNLGMTKTSGTWIQFLDGDDVLMPENFSKKAGLSSHYQIIASDFSLLADGCFSSGYNRLSAEHFTFDKIFYSWELKFTIPIHTALIRRELLSGFTFEPGLKCLEDWLMWLHVVRSSPRVAFIDEPLVAYRKEKNQNTASADLMNIVDQRLKVLPLLKERFGEALHDEYIYHILRAKSRENILLKNEIKKIQSGRLISTYLKMKRFYYQKRATK